MIDYNKTNPESPEINKQSNNEISEKISDILQNILSFKAILEESKNFFSEYEENYNDNNYNNSIGRYNSYENEFSFESELLNDYDFFFQQNLSVYENNIDLKSIKEILKK